MVGVDEVGRGAWAGPLLVVAARQTGPLPSELKDSKQLSKKQRIDIYNQLTPVCKFGEGWVKPAEIDTLGLADGLRLGVRRALRNIQASSDEKIIMDGNVNYVSKGYKKASTLVKADSLVPIVSAASIYAKITRDRFMARYDKTYPDYQFSAHVGYGTSIHRQAIVKLGIIEDLHRLSFDPMKSLAKVT